MAEEATSLDSVLKLLSLFTGSGKTTETSSGGTSTKTTEMSSEALQAILKAGLEADNGLASVLKGQTNSGLYNSSTNQLLANDLVSRLTAQAAANTKTETTNIPTTTKSTQTAGVLSGDNGTKAAALVAGGTLLKNLLGTGAKVATNSKAQGQIGDAWDKLVNAFSSSDMSPGVGISSSYQSLDGLENAISGSNIGLDASSTTGLSGSIATDLGSTNYQSAADGFMSFLSSLSSSSSGSDAETATSVVDAAANTSGENSLDALSSLLSSDKVEGASNFQQATSAVKETASSISGIESGTKAADVATSPSVTSASLQELLDAQEGYKYAESFDSAYAAADGSSAVTAADLGGASSILGEGSITGYLGSALMAMNAPEAEYGKDYREAVGSAILNYFGYSWATPIVDSIARPALDAAMDAGTESLGNFGAVLADPVGAPLSGQYDVGELITSTLDPANVLGGNEGGSTGGLAGMVVDPVGTALGGEGLAGVVSEVTNEAETSDPIGNMVGSILGQGSDGGGLPGLGKVICTELAMQDKLDIGLYKLAISPDLILKGQMLRGYHVIGVPLVKIARKSEFLAGKITPWVASYIKHKAGEWNWRGALVKSILHPLSWLLGFFNRDPDYYKCLYRRQR